jgi:hypothetical protein
MTKCSDENSGPANRDWVSNSRIYTALWGLPTWALVVGIFLPPPMRTVVWAVALIWKGVACIANARQRGRTHCYFTGPFFLIMALLVLAHGGGIVPLGPNGWLILGGVLVAGTAGIWWGSEGLLGKYVVSSRP